MTDAVALYQQIADRERRSRKEAERLLEVKSLELYEQSLAFEKKASEFSALNSILSNVMLASPDSIITCCPNFLITGMNETTEAVFGIAESEFLGRPIDEIVEISSELKCWPTPGEILMDHIEIVPKSTNPFPAEIRGNIGMQGDERCFVVLFIHDISRRQKNQTEREDLLVRINESRRLEAIGTLSSGIAHEINTPLQFIGDNVHFVASALTKINASYSKCANLKELAMQVPSLKEMFSEMESYNDSIRHDELVGEIREAMVDTIAGIKEVKDIIQVMREFVHTGNAIDQDVNINELISNALKLCRNRMKNNVKLDWQETSILPAIECRRGQVQQVLVNIILNALDALEEHKAENPMLKIHTDCGAEFLRITVADNGPGIPEGIREKIFDPFFTSKDVGKGTGQGLALAKDIIVTQSGGELKLVEVEGFTTAFQISLPI